MERHLVGRVHLLAIVKGHLDADGMCWRLDVTSHYNHTHKLVMAVLMGTNVSITYTHAIVGRDYRFRVSNLEPGVVVTDHSTFDG